MKRDLYTWLVSQKNAGKKLLAVLIDPDKADSEHLDKLLSSQNLPYIDLLLIGGSLLTKGDMDTTLKDITARCDIPTVIFPGDADQICSRADALLLLSLISGRNPDLLIGKHVASAIRLKKSELEIISTGYMIVDGGTETTASYVSGTPPLPANKPGLAAMTALAGEQLGKQVIYMDAGSGAHYPISAEMIAEVRGEIKIPIIVGGGIRDKNGVRSAWEAGADVVVIGNVLENKPSLLPELHNDVVHR